MSTAWFEQAFKIIYSALSVINHGEPAAQPIGPLVGGSFAIAGMAFGGGFQSEQATILLRSIEGTLSNIDEKVIENQALLKNIQRMLHASAEENRQMMRELQGDLRKFEHNMKHSIDALAVNLLEKHFVDTLLNRVYSLYTGMLLCITNKTLVIQDFILKYNAELPPRIALSNFALFLRNPLSNPVVAAMKLRPLNSRTILKYYTEIFTHIILQVTEVEGYYYGLSNHTENDYAEKMEHLTTTVTEATASFRDHVTSQMLEEKLYWPDVVNSTIRQDFGDAGVAEIAERIKEQLEQIYTNDVFAIYVWNDFYTDMDGKEQGDVQFSTWGPDGDKYNSYLQYDNHVIGEQRGTSIVIMRSRTFHENSKESFELMRTSFRSFALTEKYFDKTHPHHSIMSKNKNNAFLVNYKLSNELFGEKNRAHVFSVFNATPEVRFTNGGYSILQEKDLTIIPFFHGIFWV